MSCTVLAFQALALAQSSVSVYRSVRHGRQIQQFAVHLHSNRIVSYSVPLDNNTFVRRCLDHANSHIIKALPL